MTGRKCGVMFVGVNGRVASTTIIGALAIAQDVHAPSGLLTESVDCKGLDLAPVKDIAFGGWDINHSPFAQAVIGRQLADPQLIGNLQSALGNVVVFPAIDANLTDRIASLVHGRSDRRLTLRESVERIVTDLSAFKRDNGLTSVVVVNTSSTEPIPALGEAHTSIADFDAALDNNVSEISNGMLYAYAALSTGCAYVNFTPSVTVEIPALIELANIRSLPVAGKDGKTGQTLYKECLAQMFRIRGLRVRGWYSTNVLGNSDGYVLDDPQHAAAKIESKVGVLERILGYQDFPHTVRIDYHPPAGDEKEAWDLVDFEGWLGTRMSMRINWQGNDSMLAAPLILDLVRLTDFSYRSGEVGPLAHLALFFKSPYCGGGRGLFEQYLTFQEYAARARAKCAKSS